MRRFLPLFTCLAVGLLVNAESAHAQALTMQMSNGWTFAFSGNVNAFWVFEKETEADVDEVRVDPTFALVGEGRQGSMVRTGLLPAFAVFEAWGREGETDLKVHFGFAPQIQTPGGHDNFGDGTQAGAQIDMRQVYLMVSGDWGSILAGREIGVYQRQNILNDHTLFGTGPTAGNFGNAGGTTLGRIGFGYVYPNFNAQLTYTSPSGRPAQITIGLFDPSTNNGFDEVILPRLETELVFTQEAFSGWVGGMAQHQVDTGSPDPSVDDDSTAVAWGGHGGLKYAGETFSIVGSGYYGQGIGTTLKFLGGRSDEGSAELRRSYGFIGQASVTPPDSKVTLAGSYGQSTIMAADDEFDEATEDRPTLSNRAAVAGIYFQATPSLKVVGEGTYSWTDDNDDTTEKNTSFVISGGLMLFF